MPDTILCKMVRVNRWVDDPYFPGLAVDRGFYVPVPLEPGEDETGAIPMTRSYITAMEKLKEAVH